MDKEHLIDLIDRTRSGMAAIMGKWPGDETEDEIAAALDGLSSKASQWISVDDELPDDDINVLVWVPGDDLWIGYHDDDTWRYANGYPCIPTHWSKFPEGPPMT